MKGFLYILRNHKGNYYVGSTTDLSRRLSQHRSGLAKTTRDRHFNELIFSQEFNSINKARGLERKIKKWKRKDFIEKIIKSGKINTDKMRPW